MPSVPTNKNHMIDDSQDKMVAPIVYSSLEHSSSTCFGLAEVYINPVSIKIR